MLFEFLQLCLFFCSSFLNLFLKFNRVERLWHAIRLDRLAPLSLKLPLSAGWPRRFLMDLFQSGETIFYAQLASTTRVLLVLPLLLQLSSLVRRELLTTILMGALLAHRQQTSMTQTRIHA